MKRWHWNILQIRKQLWVRVTLWAITGAIAALLAAGTQYLVPWTPEVTIGAAAVESILSIIASSMLAVTTFSLSTMLSAYSAASNGVTPRATPLLMEDQLSQRVLASFIGSFLFSMVGIVALKTGIYGDSGRVVLFYFTVGMIILIVVMLLRWINHLTRLGRLGETTSRVEKAAREALQARLDKPWLGGHPASAWDATDESLTPILTEKVGYLQFIDLHLLNEIGENHRSKIHVMVLPGTFAFPTTALMRMHFATALSADERSALTQKLRSAFAIHSDRNFAQDPRFGLMVMCEIGTGALAAGATDSATAIDIIGRLTRLLAHWGQTSPSRAQAPEPDFPWLYIEPILDEDLFEDAFMQIARDGAALLEIQLRLQKSLEALAQMGSSAFRNAAREQALLAYTRSQQTLKTDYERERLQSAAEWLGADALGKS
jgi:uncharacterized membrane protein